MSTVQVKKCMNVRLPSVALRLEGDLAFARGRVCHPACWPPVQFARLPPSVHKKGRKAGAERKRQEDGEKNKMGRRERVGRRAGLGSDGREACGPSVGGPWPSEVCVSVFPPGSAGQLSCLPAAPCG